MSDDINGTMNVSTVYNSTLESPSYSAIVLMLIPMATIFGNTLVVASVYRERALQTATNYFIASLAISDFLVAACVMPFAVYIEVNQQQWHLGSTVCNIYIVTDVCASTAS